MINISKPKTFALTVFTLILFSLLGITGVVYAQELSRELLKLDETLYDESKNNQFREPESILIVPIEPPVNNFNVNSSEWYQGLYYYMAGRLSLGDILFHYSLSQDGLVFSGLTHGDEQEVFIKDGPSNPIVIAYLSESGLSDFDKNSYSDLSEFILKLANKHAIPISEVYVRKLDFIKKENSFVMEAKNPGGRYNITLSEIKREIRDLYDPTNKVYRLSTSNVVAPSEKVSPGDEVIVKFDVTNAGQYTVFKGTDAEFILSKKDGEPSRFYTTGDWLTKSESELMKEGSLLRPGETVTVEVKLTIPLYFGKQSETYVLKDLNGKTYPNTDIKITVDVKTISDPVVEVLDTETGTLNVRNAAGGQEVIETILPGERFIELDSQSGWIKIRLNDGSTGWVFAQYVRRI